MTKQKIIEYIRKEEEFHWDLLTACKRDVNRDKKEEAYYRGKWLLASQLLDKFTEGDDEE